MTLRSIAAALLGVGLLAVAVSSVDAQDNKKEKLKAPPRIAINEPTQLKDDADFAVQGEYEGMADVDGTAEKVGAQVVAQGGGKFLIKAFRGGLPGAGWDGEVTKAGSAARVGDTVTVSFDGLDVGTIAKGTLTAKVGSTTAKLTKVERKSPTLGAKPPEGAVVLFVEPGDEKNWNGGKLVELSDGKYLNTGIKTKQAFGAFKAHVEFRLPWMPNSRGQGRGNSGVYLQDRYECQVLDSFGLNGENNECGGIYTQYKPLVNACLPPLVWQTYDIEFTPAEFDADGKKTKPARTTIMHNGIKIHDNIELKGPTGGGQKEEAKPGPFQFQNHGDPLVFRNVWVVETKK